MKHERMQLILQGSFIDSSKKINRTQEMCQILSQKEAESIIYSGSEY